jgi:hypothetical protein
MDLSGLLTTDSRLPLQKLRRNALQQICKANEIPFDPSGPADKLRLLIEGSGVDYMKKDFFQKISVPNENGSTSESIVPVVKPHATANKDINYDAIIEAKAKTQEKDDENTELKARLAEMEKIVQSMQPKKEITQEMKDEYKELFGKLPHHKAKFETIQAQIDGQNAS